MTCHVWVCTSPGHWSLARRVYIKDSHNAWKLGKSLWLNSKGHWLNKCTSLLGYGYILGGNDRAVTTAEHATNTTERIDLSRDVVKKLSIILPNSGEYPCCFSDSTEAFVSDYNWVNKFVFKTETAAKCGHLASWRYDNTGLTDMKKMGYSLGGRQVGEPALPDIFRYDMVTHASAKQTNLPHAVQFATPTYSLTRGWLLGGSPGKGSLARSLNYIQRFQFSTKTALAIGHTFCVPIQAAGTATSKSAGYTAGGYISNKLTNKITVFTHSNETSAAKSATLKQVLAMTSGMGAGTHGVFFGGASVISGKYVNITATIQTYTYATNVSAVKNVALSQGRNKAGVGTDRGVLL